MAFNSAIRDAMAAPGGPSQAATRDAIEGYYTWTPQPGDDVTQFTPGLTRAIVYQGLVFQRDDADTTSAHDGTTTLVLQGGIRFKVAGFAGAATSRVFRVESETATPPGSPTLGQSWLVGAGATGAWATHDSQIASWSSSGWRYTVPKAFDQAWNVATAEVKHYSSGGAWTSGLPGVPLGNYSVVFTKLQHGLGLAVENTTTNTPPGSPTDGVAYVIGPSPTGAWSGSAGRVALYTSGAWLIAAPAIGWQVYDKSAKAMTIYTASGWQAGVSGYAQVSTAVTAGTVLSGGTYTYSSGTAPTTGGMADVVLVSHTAKKAGALLEVTFTCDDVTYAGAPSIALGIFIDATANAEKWTRLPPVTSYQGTVSYTVIITAADTSAHDVKVKASGSSITFLNPRIIVRELA